MFSLLAFSLPMGLGGAGMWGSAHLTMPAAAGVRSAVADLAAFVTDSHAPAPKTPKQQSGSAAGRPHQVPAAVTSAVARAAGRTPGKGPGQMPAYTVHAPTIR